MSSTRPLSSRPSRSERLEARISPALKDKFQRAAAARGQTLTEFVVSVLAEAADRTVREQEIIELTERDQRAFAEALLSPSGRPTSKLVEAVAMHRRRVETVD